MIFFWKSDIAILKNPSFYVFWFFLFAFCSKSLFLWFFKHLSIDDQKWMTLGHLYWYNSKRFRENFSKNLCKDVKLIYEEVYHVPRRYLQRYGRYSRKTEGRPDPTPRWLRVSKWYAAGPDAGPRDQCWTWCCAHPKLCGSGAGPGFLRKFAISSL